MREFRVGATNFPRKNNPVKIRVVLWGAVLALSALTLFAVYGGDTANREVMRGLAWFAGLIVLASIVAAQFIAIRLGLEKVKRSLVFVLTNDSILRKRDGWPDVNIGLSEIHRLYEAQGSLVIESVAPFRRIVVPDSVDGFESLRSELCKHQSVTIPPQKSTSKALAAGRSFGPAILSLLCWGCVLWASNTRVALIAGAIALVLLGWSSLRLLRRSKNTQKRLAIWTFLGFSWITAFWVVYLRVGRS
jgi:hypothetical protein